MYSVTVHVPPVDDAAISDDDAVAELIPAVTEAVEGFLRRSLATQTLRLTLNDFRDPTGFRDPYGHQHTPNTIYLPRPPLQSVTSVAYVDADGEEQVVDAADYVVDVPGSRLFPAPGKSWPLRSELRPYSAVTIEYVAGYGGAEDIPEAIKQAILREATVLAKRTPGLRSESIDNASRTWADSGEISDMAKSLIRRYRVM